MSPPDCKTIRASKLGTQGVWRPAMNNKLINYINMVFFGPKA